MESPEMMSCPQSAVASIMYDVTDLDRSCAFYGETLGFRHVSTDRKDLPYEIRTLECDQYPALALCLRKSYRRPVIGSLPGGFIAIGLRVANVREAVARLTGKVSFLTQILPAGPLHKVQFFDPDGYVIELFD